MCFLFIENVILTDFPFHSENLPCNRFVLRDKKENSHSNINHKPI